MNITQSELNPIDVWLKFDAESDETPSHEANTFLDGERFRVEWYHVDVGQVTKIYCDTYEEVRTLLEEHLGYREFSTEDAEMVDLEDFDTRSQLVTAEVDRRARAGLE